MIKYRVAVHNAIAARGLERLPHANYIVGKGLSTPDAILLRSHVLESGDIPPTVKAIARAGAGVNNIPVAAMEQVNIRKAARLYDYIDGQDFYSNPIAKPDRSRMNVPFRLRDEALDKPFLAEAEALGLSQLKGHRSVGGMRASI